MDLGSTHSRLDLIQWSKNKLASNHHKLRVESISNKTDEIAMVGVLLDINEFLANFDGFQ